MKDNTTHPVNEHPEPNAVIGYVIAMRSTGRMIREDGTDTDRLQDALTLNSAEECVQAAGTFAYDAIPCRIALYLEEILVEEKGGQDGA